MNIARTLQSVETALSKVSLKQNDTGTGYLSCRYAPFDSKSHGVPDGIGNQMTTRDYYSVFDITAPPAGLYIVIPPFAPIQAMFRPAKVGETVRVNNETFTAAPDWNSDANSGRIFMPCCSTAIGTLCDLPYNSSQDIEQFITSARIVTVGYRLYYTGPAATCEGTISATSFPLKLDSFDTTNSKKFGIKDYDGTTEHTQDLDHCKVAFVDWNPISNNLAPTSVITRPEHGMHGILPRRVAAKAHGFKPFHERGAYLISDKGFTGNGSSLYGSICASHGGLEQPWTVHGRTGIPAASVIDDDFNAVVLWLTTGDATKFRLEVMTCIQFEHTNSFPLVSLTSSAMPANDAVMNKDDAINAALKPGAAMGSAPMSMAMVQLPQRVRRGKQPRQQQRRPQRKPKQRRQRQPPRRARKAKAQGTVSIRV